MNITKNFALSLMAAAFFATSAPEAFIPTSASANSGGGGGGAGFERAYQKKSSKSSTNSIENTKKYKKKKAERKRRKAARRLARYKKKLATYQKRRAAAEARLKKMLKNINLKGNSEARKFLKELNEEKARIKRYKQLEKIYKKRIAQWS